ncbi:Ada metal-binding domain-containing protein [Symbiobacterium terraclitae]|uniref:Ada metal-binding domain-containing protein n=1 Tax=Symbiobacterium terraclitae TaxID=557451 RepID=UPI0035B565BE
MAGLAPGELQWDEGLYQAVLRADASADGRFFFAVRTTGVFCYPSCSCRKPRRENVRFFASAGAAVAAGFRPCKRCRPDLGGGVRGYEAALVQRALTLALRHGPSGMARELSVSLPHLNRLFRRHLGGSVRQCVLRLRAERAAALLDAGASPLEAADACGFRSLSAFYAAFRRVHGMAPGEYRSRHHKEGARDAVHVL